jgi:hypothetical protein
MDIFFYMYHAVGRRMGNCLEIENYFYNTIVVFSKSPMIGVTYHRTSTAKKQFFFRLLANEVYYKTFLNHIYQRWARFGFFEIQTEPK